MHRCVHRRNPPMRYGPDDSHVLAQLRHRLSRDRGIGPAARAAVAVLALAILASLGAGGGTTADAVQRRSAAAAAGVHATGGPGAPPLTATQLASDLVAATHLRRVPANLSPPLSHAAAAYPLIRQNGCQIWDGQVKSRPCMYGDTHAQTTVALFGDSHASAWFPALNLISSHNRWRLAIFTKSGCPPPEVTIVHGGVRYTDCNAWRSNSLRQIAALHPALVIVTWARWLQASATAESGVPTGHGGAWQDGVAAIFAALHRRARATIFISDVPLLTQGAPGCISHHLSDVRPCNAPRRTAVELPTVKSEELALAQREHVNAIDPTRWFCTATACPVIADNIILYRDTSHMTPQWSRFIAPVLAAALAPTTHTAAPTTGSR